LSRYRPGATRRKLGRVPRAPVERQLLTEARETLRPSRASTATCTSHTPIDSSDTAKALINASGPPRCHGSETRHRPGLERADRRDRPRRGRLRAGWSEAGATARPNAVYLRLEPGVSNTIRSPGRNSMSAWGATSLCPSLAATTLEPAGQRSSPRRCPQAVACGLMVMSRISYPSSGVVGTWTCSCGSSTANSAASAPRLPMPEGVLPVRA
jgi:hypothetical protein